jgi:hypothetical protein
VFPVQEPYTEEEDRIILQQRHVSATSTSTCPRGGTPLAPVKHGHLLPPIRECQRLRNGRLTLRAAAY